MNEYFSTTLIWIIVTVLIIAGSIKLLMKGTESKVDVIEGKKVMIATKGIKVLFWIFSIFSFILILGFLVLIIFLSSRIDPRDILPFTFIILFFLAFNLIAVWAAVDDLVTSIHYDNESIIKRKNQKDTVLLVSTIHSITFSEGMSVVKLYGSEKVSISIQRIGMSEFLEMLDSTLPLSVNRNGLLSALYYCRRAQ